METTHCLIEGTASVTSMSRHKINYLDIPERGEGVWGRGTEPLRKDSSSPRSPVHKKWTEG